MSNVPTTRTQTRPAGPVPIQSPTSSTEVAVDLDDANNALAHALRVERPYTSMIALNGMMLTELPCFGC
jgi:hypothetical protein